MSTLDMTPHKPRGGGQTRWSSKSKAAEFLRQGLETKLIDGNAKPKEVYDQFPHVFGGYSLDSFRPYYNKTRKEMGYFKRKDGEEVDDDAVDCRKPAASFGCSNGEEDDDDISGVGVPAKRAKSEGKASVVRNDLEDEMTFKPLYWCESFKKNNSDKLGILLNVPSGCDPAKATFTVEDNGWTLKLKVKWSKWFSDPKQFFEFFLRRPEGAAEIAPNTHRMIQFEEARSRKIEESNCGNTIVSTALIPLPIQVQNNIDFTCGAGKDNARCIYVECFADNQKATKQIAESYYE